MIIRKNRERIFIQYNLNNYKKENETKEKNLQKKLHMLIEKENKNDKLNSDKQRKYNTILVKKKSYNIYNFPPTTSSISTSNSSHNCNKDWVYRLYNEEMNKKKLEYEKRKAAEEEEKKKQDRLRAKYLIQQQMKDREKLKEEAKKEYEKDKIDVDNMINKLKEEDLAAQAEAERKKNIQKLYMENAYAEKDARREREKEEDRLQKERERKYHEDVQKREDELNNKKAAIQFEKDKIFEQLCQQEAKRQAERDYWENVRNELYVEQDNHKAKLKELEEK